MADDDKKDTPTTPTSKDPSGGTIIHSGGAGDTIPPPQNPLPTGSSDTHNDSD